MHFLATVAILGQGRLSAISDPGVTIGVSPSLPPYTLAWCTFWVVRACGPFCRFASF